MGQSDPSPLDSRSSALLQLGEELQTFCQAFYCCVDISHTILPNMHVHTMHGTIKHRVQNPRRVTKTPSKVIHTMLAGKYDYSRAEHAGVHEDLSCARAASSNAVRYRVV